MFALLCSVLVHRKPPNQESKCCLKNALTLLDGGSTLEPVPDWTDTGHPAYGLIYGLLKTQFGVDGVRGVNNPSHVVKFLVKLSQLLNLLSTFSKT